MHLEAVSVDCSVRFITDRPLHADDIARIIAEALNREYPGVGDPTEVIQVDIANEVEWADSKADEYA